MYDVIIVGARVAGSATAMLLARRGLKILVLERAAFPSDTLSTHQIQLPGVARLQRWGLLEPLIAAGTPPTRQVTFDPGPVVLRGQYPSFQGVDALYSPRRTILDGILADTARLAGAELREKFVVEELVFEGRRVTGVRGHQKGGSRVTEKARLVVGADGKHSMVAKAVNAARYQEKPALSMACYTYWEGVPVAGGEMYGRQRRMVGVWPTNEGLVMTYVACPLEDFAAFHADLEGSFVRTLDETGDLGQRVRAGRRAERFRATTDLPNFFRKPYGEGWALVGDAGLVMDPITGHGIADAFRDAELLADAIDQGFGGRRRLDLALAGYEQARNREALPIYEFTTELASFGPPRPEQQILLTALAGRQAQIDRFLGVLTGVEPLPAYFSPRNLLRIVGPIRLARMVLGQRRGSSLGPAAAVSLDGARAAQTALPLD
jgi:2-polyprenyl-6-methoxyphenol hydroxylase-like FAD-dependent oxidoreductase